MMAQPVPHQPSDRRRVKVYELRDNDWFDRGTGFCATTVVNVQPAGKDARLIVESEDQPGRCLLETTITKEDGFQRQQDTLIVWTEQASGVDMALSFQEGDGCAAAWRFINRAQMAFNSGGIDRDEGLADEATIEAPAAVSLPVPELGSLSAIETTMRAESNSSPGRDMLAKFIMRDDYAYMDRLVPLVEMAEDLESISDLHMLCNIFKTVLLLNDAGIMEHAVSDQCLRGVIGALEYDPEFPTRKANHRAWLSNEGRFREVVPIDDTTIKKKIHTTYRLQYLKDVVLARILDDPTFSVLNSLIFFNQVEIITHIQENAGLVVGLFAIFKPSRAAVVASAPIPASASAAAAAPVAVAPASAAASVASASASASVSTSASASTAPAVAPAAPATGAGAATSATVATVTAANTADTAAADRRQRRRRRRDALLFIQQCCAIAKNLQPPARGSLYTAFLAEGLIRVILYGVRHPDVAVRVAAADILVSLIDHDPQPIRAAMYRQQQQQRGRPQSQDRDDSHNGKGGGGGDDDDDVENQSFLAEALIDLLLNEADLGVKSHVSEALRILLDPGPPPEQQQQHHHHQQQQFGRANGDPQHQLPEERPLGPNLSQEHFIEKFYESVAYKLCKPLADLDDRAEGVLTLTPQQASVCGYVVELISWFIRLHHDRSMFFVQQHNVTKRVTRLLLSRDKHVQLVAIRFFRQLSCCPGNPQASEFYRRHIADKGILGLILDLLIATLPRDNLLSSACLELFEFLKKDGGIYPIKRLVEKHRKKLLKLSHLETFREMIYTYDRTLTETGLDFFLNPENEAASKRKSKRRDRPKEKRQRQRKRRRHQKQQPRISADDANNRAVRGYGEDGDVDGRKRPHAKTGEKTTPPSATNGEPVATPRPLVDYTSDEEADETADLKEAGKTTEPPEESPAPAVTVTSPTKDAAETIGPSVTVTAEETKAQERKEGQQQQPPRRPVPPPERLSEKRRREEEDDDDAISSLMQDKKRRNSTSVSSNSSSPGGIMSRHRRSSTGGSVKGGSPSGPKISISLTSALKTAAAATTEARGDGGGGDS